MIYVWDGLEASSLTKSTAYLKALELNVLFQKARDHVLKVLFSGGVVRGNKLQRGSVFIMADILLKQSSGQASLSLG